MPELAARAGVTPRTVRYYLERGIVPPPAEFRGTATRYGREHLVVLHAVLALKKKERLPLDAIRRRLSAMAPEELERYAPDEPPAPGAADGAPKLGESAAPAAAAIAATEAWHRLVLLPGVELFVKAGVSPAIARLVQEVRDHFVGAAT